MPKIKDEIPTMRQVKILWHLYLIANAQREKNKYVKCRFTGLPELAKQLEITYQMLMIDINKLAENDFINIEFHEKGSGYPAKTFQVVRPERIEVLTEKYRKDCLRSLEILRNICNRNHAEVHNIPDDFYF